MNILKRMLAVSFLSFAIILPSAKTISINAPISTSTAAVFVCVDDICMSAPETGAQYYDKTDQTEKKSDEKESKKFSPVRSVVISLIISLVIAFVVVGSMRSKMKTVRRQSGASGYTKDGSFKLEVNTDTYLYNKIEKTARPKSGNS